MDIVLNNFVSYLYYSTHDLKLYHMKQYYLIQHYLILYNTCQIIQYRMILYNITVLLS